MKEAATPRTEPCSDAEVVAVVARLHAAGHGRGERLELLFVVPVNDNSPAAGPASPLRIAPPPWCPARTPAGEPRRASRQWRPAARARAQAGPTRVPRLRADARSSRLPAPVGRVRAAPSRAHSAALDRDPRSSPQRRASSGSPPATCVVAADWRPRRGSCRPARRSAPGSNRTPPAARMPSPSRPDSDRFAGGSRPGPASALLPHRRPSPPARRPGRSPDRRGSPRASVARLQSARSPPDPWLGPAAVAAPRAHGCWPPARPAPRGRTPDAVATGCV